MLNRTTFRKLFLAAGGAVMAAGGCMLNQSHDNGTPKPGGSDQLDRTVLPIQLPKPPPVTAMDVRDAKMPPWVEVKAPAGGARREADKNAGGIG